MCLEPNWRHSSVTDGSICWCEPVCTNDHVLLFSLWSSVSVLLSSDGTF